MPSPNLSITHVAAAQNQKEVTINDAVDALDNAMNRALSLAMADANVTLTADQANRNGLIVPRRAAEGAPDRSGNGRLNNGPSASIRSRARTWGAPSQAVRKVVAA